MNGAAVRGAGAGGEGRPDAVHMADGSKELQKELQKGDGRAAAGRPIDPDAMSPKARRAYELFLQGYNCAQSVAGAFAGEMGLPQETVMRMACGFGGGIGRLRD